MRSIATRAGALLLLGALLTPAAATAHDGDRVAIRPDAAAPVASRAFDGAVLPPGFRDEVVFAGLDQPTAAEQADDGRLFVLEKPGRLLVFDDLMDPTPTVALDIQQDVHNYYDRGALGFTLDPDFETTGYVYVLFAYDHRLGDPAPAPAWGNDDNDGQDACPGDQDLGCEISNRLVRYTLTGSAAATVAGSPKVLVEDWCQQFGSHSAGALQFDVDGYLYASGGEGANYDRVDWGQFDDDPCGDPVDEGGRLRAQDVRTPGDPTGLGGSVIRIDPATGQGAPGNPLSSSTDANARRLVAHGFRNPFRFALRPGTRDLYVGDVGEGEAEEIDHVGAGRSTLPNFGWPCFEGSQRYPSLDKPLCTSLKSSDVQDPLFQYSRDQEVVPGEDCKNGTASTSAMAFVESTAYPAAYRGALVFGDFARDCIWYLPAKTDGTPDAQHPELLVGRAGNPVDLFTGADGDLFYVDIAIDETGQGAEGGGKIHRISYQPGRPIARIASSAPYGPIPLQVDFDATTSSDPDGDELTYEWDLDDDGTFDTTFPTPSPQYEEARDYVARLRVTDSTGLTDEATLRISAGNLPPVVSMGAPVASLTWSVGEEIEFKGSANDPDDGPLPPTALDWTVSMAHCPGECHTHPVYGFSGRDSGSFTAIDHELPSHLVVTATATDSRGLTTSVVRELYPHEVNATFGTAPAGLSYRLEGDLGHERRSLRVISGEQLAVATDPRQWRDGKLWQFRSWTSVRSAEPTATVTIPVAKAVSYVARFGPVKRTVRISASVPGLRVRVAGKLRASVKKGYQVGTRLAVGAPRRQRVGGRTYVFVRWSDGKPAKHRYVVPDRRTTLTAIYRRG